MILVTGAAGLSGSIVVREFVRQGAQVRALVRRRASARARELEALPGVELVEGDMDRPETLGAALQGVPRVLMISSSDERMVETQSAFVDACKRAGVGHVVKFSGQESSVGFRQERFRFTRMHGEIERYLERSGLAWTHLRPSQFMQVYFREVATLATQGALFLPMGDARLSPIDVEDIARVAFTLLRDGGHEGEACAMTGPEALSMAEVAERISRGMGRPVRYVNIAPEEKRLALLAAGTPPSRADALDELFAERRRCLESKVDLSTHQAFGVRPTSFEEFARRSAAIFRGEAEPP